MGHCHLALPNDVKRSTWSHPGFFAGDLKPGSRTYWRLSGIGIIGGDLSLKERARRFELLTSSLGSWHSTTELRPQRFGLAWCYLSSQTPSTERCCPRPARLILAPALLNDSRAIHWSSVIQDQIRHDAEMIGGECVSRLQVKHAAGFDLDLPVDQHVVEASQTDAVELIGGGARRIAYRSRRSTSGRLLANSKRSGSLRRRIEVAGDQATASVGSPCAICARMIRAASRLRSSVR